MPHTQIRKILTGSAALLSARVVILALGIVRIGLIARYLGVEEFGTYTFAMSFVLMALTVAELGLPSILIREGAKDRARIPGLMKSAFLLRAAVVLVVLLVCAAAFPRAGSSPHITLSVVLLCAGFGLSSLSLLLQCANRALQQMGVVAAVQVAKDLILFGLIYAALVMGYGLLGICGAIAATGVLNLGASLAVYRVLVGPLPLRERASKVSYLIREGLPAAVSVMVPDLMINLSIVVLMAVRTRQEVAYMGASLRFMSVFIFIPGAYQGAVYPMLSSLFDSSTHAFRLLLTRSVELMILSGLLLTVLTGLMADEMVTLVYGPGYEPAAAALRLLSPTVLFAFVSSLVYPFFIVVNRQRLGMGLSLAGLAVTLALAVPMSARYGFTGDTVAVMMGAGFLSVAALFALRRLGYCAGLVRFALKAACAGASLFIVVSLLAPFHLLLRLGCGTAVYLLFLALLKGIRGEDFRTLLGALGLTRLAGGDACGPEGGTG